jgi:outer membrane receptor protein involved in Fe transport
VGVFAAIRYAGRRALDRDNVFFLEPYSEWDAGASLRVKSLRVSVTGRNLGDDRHVVAESEIGDLQFYLAPPRRVTAELSYGF